LNVRSPDLSAFTLYKFEHLLNKIFGPIFKHSSEYIDKNLITYRDEFRVYTYMDNNVITINGVYHVMVWSGSTTTKPNPTIKAPLNINLYYKSILIRNKS
jgi:hypothetical protein